MICTLHQVTAVPLPLSTSLAKRATPPGLREMCAKWCSMAQGGNLCDCNARHFLGKRTDTSSNTALPSHNAETRSSEEVRPQLWPLPSLVISRYDGLTLSQSGTQVYIDKTEWRRRLINSNIYNLFKQRINSTKKLLNSDIVSELYNRSGADS